MVSDLKVSHSFLSLSVCLSARRCVRVCVRACVHVRQREQEREWTIDIHQSNEWLWFSFE